MRLTGVQSHRRTSSQNIFPSLSEATVGWGHGWIGARIHWVHWPAPEEYIRIYKW